MSGQQSGPVKIVAVFLDGQYLNGFVLNFSPLSDRFTVFPSESAPASESQEVDLRNVKCIHFVKEFSGLDRQGAGDFIGVSHGRKIEVAFADGDRLVGTTEGYHRERPGFFMAPANTTGNLLRIFVVNAHVSKVKWL